MGRETDMGQHGPLPMPGAELKPSPGSALADLLGVEPTHRRPLSRKCLLDEGGLARSGLADGWAWSCRPGEREPFLPRHDPLRKQERGTA